MKILSLFDGISCARVALEKAGIKVDGYFASEIDKYAIEVSKKNWPDIKHIVPEATKKGYAIAQDGDSIDLSFPNSATRRGRVGNKVKNLMTSQNINVFTGGRVRKLTPLECDRLQSLPDNYTEGISDSQRYKCLGNAFNADVIAYILKYIK